MIDLMKTININKILKKDENKEVVNTLDLIKEYITSAEKIIVMTHDSPDGDAVGCTLAMNKALRNFNKEADIYIPEYSRLFGFLPGANEIKSNIDENVQYDLAISLDCADTKRLIGYEFFENAKKTIVIDHHGSNQMYGDINFVNPAAPACAEVLVSIFQYLEIPIEKDIGSCLLTGIITDTGGFSYSGVTADTFEFTAELIRKGVHITELYKKVFQTKTKTHFELAKRIMDRTEFYEDGKIAFTYMTSKDEEEVKAEPGDQEGLVEIGRDIEGVELSIFAKQKEGKDLYKISMRSDEYVNVSDLCLIYGGGGHPRAAGCQIKGSLDDIKTKLLNQAKKAVQK